MQENPARNFSQGRECAQGEASKTLWSQSQWRDWGARLASQTMEAWW